MPTETQPKKVKKLRKPTAIEISLVWLITLAITATSGIFIGGYLQRQSDAHDSAIRIEAVQSLKETE